MTKPRNSLAPIRVGLVVPHIFMQAGILPRVIFSPGQLALSLTDNLKSLGADVTLFTPGKVETGVHNITADLSYFERELAGRGDDYLDLLRKHPFTFITLARQVQSELIARAYQLANDGQLDIVHIYTNEEEIALPFASLCTKPVLFTHHDPFNFLVRYKNNLPKYKQLNWISMSHAQRRGMPDDTNWVANIYHGLDDPVLRPVTNPNSNYIAYLGRIIQPKGLHLAIQGLRQYNTNATSPLYLKIAGKHYSEGTKDDYWQRRIAPEIGNEVELTGYISSSQVKRQFLGNARALIVPSLFDEPFGMVAIEAYACGTPVIALDSGALPETVTDGLTGYVVPKQYDAVTGELDETATAARLAKAINRLDALNRADARNTYEARFTAARMAREHLELYHRLRARK